MIEHISIPIKDYVKARTFYAEVLKPLGYTLTKDFPDEAGGFSEGGHTSFWIVRKETGPVHVAFLAPNKEAVDAFYATALNNGAKDNGKPGTRENYSPDYYAAFILDPDGNNIEAVCFDQS
jgi:catechol 2,3-dioxygenase-like lactoylglutathione lyase family enzyme